MNCKRMYRLLLVLLSALAAPALAGCGAVLVRPVAVMVAEGEGYTVVGENPRYVLPGEEAVFTLELEEGYTLVAAEGAAASGSTVTVSRVLYPVTVVPDVRTEVVYYDLTLLDPMARGAIRTSVAPGAVAEGTSVTLAASPDEGYRFIGWYNGDRTELITENSPYTFTMTADTTLIAAFRSEEEIERLQAKAVLVYNANGGECTLPGAVNGICEETIALRDLKLPNCMADLGQFVREGFHLVEYNTSPDGTGEGYSLGSKIMINTGIEKTDSALLYCIWKKESAPSLFAYTEKDGELTITDYCGEEEELIIPAYIDGKPVTGIAGGAVKNKSFTTLSLPKTLRTVQSEAFVNCEAFTTLYFPDLVESIPDDAFVGCENFRNFYLNAVTAPRRGHTSSKKFEAMVTTQDQNRVIVVSGSSSIAGLDSTLIQKALDDQYFVVNYGTSAASCGMFYLEMISHFVHDGDVVVHAPEFTESQIGRNRITWINFRDTEGYYNFFRYVDMRSYEGLFSAFTLSQQSRLPVAERSYNTPLTGYDEHGDRTVSYPGLNSPDFTSNLNIRYDPAEVTDEYGANLEMVHQMCMDAGARVYVTFAPHNHNGLTETGRTEENKLAYTARLEELFTAPVIGTLGDYTLAGEYFYDTDWHPNDEGRRLHSTQMAKDIRAQMEKDGILR